MSAKSRKSKGQPASAHPPVTLAIPVTALPATIDGWYAEIDAMIQQWHGDLAILVYGVGLSDEELKKDESLVALANKTDLFYQGGFQYEGEALQAAANNAEHPYLVTWTRNNTIKPGTLRSWTGRFPNGLPDKAIVLGQRELPDKKTRHSLKAIEGNGDSRFRGFTNMRLTDPGSPLKCYPTSLAQYLFSQLPASQAYFEAAALHWATHEGIAVQQITVKPDLQNPAVHTEQPKSSPVWSSLVFKFHYQLLHPFRAIRKEEQPERPPFMGKAHNGMKLAFSTLLILLFIGMPLLSFDYGVTGDENLQHNYGKKLLDYYFSFGSDKSALNYKDLYLYGGLFEFFASGTAKLIDPLVEGKYTYEIRHVLNALTGFIAILFTALLGKYLGSWRGGLLALLMLVFSPRFFGHAMNNPKDIPFAAFYIMGIYFLIKLLAELPKPDKRTIGWLIVAIGASISVRIGGLLLIAYMGLFLLVALFRQQVDLDRGNFFRRIVRIGLITGIGGYLAGLIFWPYGHQNPFLNPFRALSNMSDFPTVISVLFEGQIIQSSNVPWYYLLKYLVFTAPLFALMGFGLMLILIPFWKPKQQLYWYWPVLFAAIFPVVYIIYKDANLYDGMRQALFIYPPFVLAGSFAFRHLYERFHQWGPQLVISGGLASLMAIPAWFMVSEHPNQVVYYNGISGGLEEAYGQYELDYWGNSTKQAANKLVERIQENGTPDSTITVQANFRLGSAVVLDRNLDSIQVNYGSYKERSRKEWDYAIFVHRFIPPRKLKNYWPPKGTVDQVKVNGTAITTIVKRNNYHDLKGFRHLENREFRKAIADFEAYREYNPQNARVLSALARAYARTQQLNKAQQAAQQALKISPGNPRSLGILGMAYQQRGQTDKAIRYFEKAIKGNRGYAMGYYQLGQLYYQKRQPRRALRYLNALRQVRPSLYKRASSLVERCRKMARQQ